MIRSFETLLYDNADPEIQVIRDSRPPVTIYVDIDGRPILHHRDGQWLIAHNTASHIAWRLLFEPAMTTSTPHDRIVSVSRNALASLMRAINDEDDGLTDTPNGIARIIIAQTGLLTSLDRYTASVMTDAMDRSKPAHEHE